MVSRQAGIGGAHQEVQLRGQAVCGARAAPLADPRRRLRGTRSVRSGGGRPSFSASHFRITSCIRIPSLGCVADCRGCNTNPDNELQEDSPALPPLRAPCTAGSGFSRGCRSFAREPRPTEAGRGLGRTGPASFPALQRQRSGVTLSRSTRGGGAPRVLRRLQRDHVVHRVMARFSI